MDKGLTLDVDTFNRKVREYLESRKDNTFLENRSITPWLQCSEGEDDMTDVDTKPISGNKCINGQGKESVQRRYSSRTIAWQQE